MQCECIDVDDRRCDVGIREQAHFAFDQIPLGGDEQHGHLGIGALRIEDLEVELDRFHVERNVLFRFPPYYVARLVLPGAGDLNLLDDYVAAADSGDHILERHTGGNERILYGAGDDAGIHDLALDDRIRDQWADRDLHQLGLALGVVNDRDLDEPGSNVEANRRLFPTEEHHGSSGRERQLLRSHTAIQFAATGRCRRLPP